MKQPIGSGVYRVFFGNLDDPSQSYVWTPPWSDADKSIIHVGWDGDAFAVHAANVFDAWYVVTRLDWDGSKVTEVLPPTTIGTNGDILPGNTELKTDPETGITWAATISAPGVWMSGHDRDGKPLPGVGPLGGEHVQYPGADGLSHEVALAPFGESVYVVWDEYQGDTPAYAAWVDTSFKPRMDPVRLNLEPNQQLVQKTVVRVDDGWTIVAKDRHRVKVYELGDAGTFSQREFVSFALYNVVPDMRIFTSVNYHGELWCGFWDQSDGFFDGMSAKPYRIVRVKDGCSYKSLYDIRAGK